MVCHQFRDLATGNVGDFVGGIESRVTGTYNCGIVGEANGAERGSNGVLIGVVEKFANRGKCSRNEKPDFYPKCRSG